MELLPCPFCGGEATFDHDDNGWNWISCGKCGVSTNCRTHTMEDCHRLLAEQWNRRVIPLHEMMGDCRKQFDDWWSEFTSAHEDWRFTDNDALRWQAWQAAWNLRASPASAPEGWKIVPVEPTGEMVDAGIRSLGTADKFRAMLAAAPTPPVSEDWKDAELLDFLDRNLSKNIGWRVGLAPFGNIGLTSILNNKTSIREAIKKAMHEDKP